jgi:hypothetical protein
VPTAGLLRLTRALELLERELADQLQQPVAHRVVVDLSDH